MKDIKYVIEELLSKKFMILLEVDTGRYHSLSQIAEKVGITKQGVSEYLKKMKEEGIIEVIEGEYRATVKGVEKLFLHLSQLEKYMEEKRKKLNIIEICSAIAGNDIKKGEKVALFMSNGYLYAFVNKTSSSYAEAIENAKKGEDVAIKNIRGIIDLCLGKISLFSLPSAEKGGAKKVNSVKLKSKIEEINADRIGVMDIVGKVALDNAKIKYDFEFCPINSAIEACQRGLNVILVGEEKEMRHAISLIEEYNSNALDEIKYEVFYF